MPQFNTMRHGYNIEEVNNYIATLESALAEYREKDAAITKAMISAQVAADNIVKNAHWEAKAIRQETVEHLDKVADSIEKQRRMISRFERDYNDLIAKYMFKIKESDFLEAKASVDVLEACLNALKEGVETIEKDSE